MNWKINKQFQDKESELLKIINEFDFSGQNFGNQERNSLKLFEFEGMTVNVKSFKIPNAINQVVYRFFRKSKAQRSFEYANKLQELGIGTPQPIAYFESKTPLLFKKSYYMSEQLNCEYTYRDLTFDFNIPDYEAILRAFTRFTFTLHENHVLFLDHSPGNTLISIEDDGFDFFLVDLNRMEFKNLNFNERIKNFARLTTHKEMVEVMSDEYAKCMNQPYEKVFDLMWQYTNDFQEKYYRKKRWKNRLLFWRT